MSSRDTLPTPDRQRVVSRLGRDTGALPRRRQGRRGRVDATVPMVFSADETTDVGSDSGTPVSDDLDMRESRFTGRVRWVELDLGDDAHDADHLITDEERLSIAMARR